MRHLLWLVPLLAACGPAAFDPIQPFDPGWVKVFEDSFDGPAGSAPDPAVWTPDTGAGGWGNDELQNYTDRPDNLRLSGNGTLLIVAHREAYEGSDWTSARIQTLGLLGRTYGAFEARMKLPAGKGLWPAFWLLGNDVFTSGWPLCGEVDVMEMQGEAPQTVFQTLHGPGYAGAASVGDATTLPQGTFADDFHTFRVEIDPEYIAWFIDDDLVARHVPGDLPDGAPWVFDHPMFMLLNLAVGGTFVQAPDASTPDEAVLEVDDVKVFERATDPTDTGAP